MKLNKRLLGRTGLYVTELGLGGYQFTGEFGVHYDEAKKILDHALEYGVNYIDTAQMYGFGESEALVGQALRRHADKEIYISDKVGYIDRTVSRASGEAGYQDIIALKRMIKHSMWLLQRDYIDIFMIHEPNVNDWWHFDYDTGDAVVTTVLEELKKEGIIGAIGLGCWDSQILARLCSTGRFDVALNAGGMSLFDRPMFHSLIPVAQKHNVGIVLGGALGQGFAVDILKKDRVYAQKLIEGDDEKLKERGKKALKLYDIADQAGIPSMIELTIRYVLSFKEIHSHVPGARCVEHIKENISFAEKGSLSNDVVEAIMNI